MTKGAKRGYIVIASFFALMIICYIISTFYNKENQTQEEQNTVIEQISQDVINSLDEK